MSTICRAVGIVAVWWSALAFLNSSSMAISTQMGRDGGPIYLLCLLIVVSGSVIATAILWLGYRPKRRRSPSADRAFEVVPPAGPA